MWESDQSLFQALLAHIEHDASLHLIVHMYGILADQEAGHAEAPFE